MTRDEAFERFQKAIAEVLDVEPTAVVRDAKWEQDLDARRTRHRTHRTRERSNPRHGPRARRGRRVVLEGGELVAILGGNGSGKSSLLWAVAGLLRPVESTRR